MAILQHETIESTSGFAKEIEESALTMIFDNLQSSQYHYPIKSTVREIGCNALDSVKERNAVIAILEGKKKEEDYFIRRDEPLYKDSNFDKSYYDLNWLSLIENILITYYANGTTGDKDKITIRDWGVGLGGKRLEGYMRLGYSTKRNSKLNIGKYGLGAKAPLSTSADSFRMTTAHNGRLFKFDIYSHKVDSVIPKLNLEKDIINPFYKFTNGYEAYYEETKDLNFTEIEIETKKHHKQPYIDAIKSQLLYMKGIDFIVQYPEYQDRINVTSKVLFEDDKLILADNHQYSKPHIVLDGVTYGYIDFLELELENKLGNIGVKVSSEEVSVTPSRETVVWNEKTRETIVTRFKEAVGIATKIVEKELQETKLIKWLEKCRSVLGTTNNNSIVGRLSAIIDKSDISPAFPGDSSIKFKKLENFFQGFRFRIIQNIQTGTWRNPTNKISRVTLSSWNSIDFDSIFLQKENTSHTKDVYLYKTIHHTSSRHIVILEPLELPEDHKLSKKQVKDYLTYQETLLKAFSKEVKNYDTIVIPEDWKLKLTDAIKEEEEGKIKPVEVTPKERRALNESTVYKLPYFNWNEDTISYNTKEWQISTINDMDDDPAITSVIYGFQEDRDLISFFASNKPRKLSDQAQYPILLLISKSNEKYYMGLKKACYVKNAFKRINLKEKSITMHEAIITYNTYRIVEKELRDLDFMRQYEAIDPDIAEKFKAITTYMQTHKSEHSVSIIKKEIDEYLDKITTFQLFVIEVEGNAKLVSAKSQELFGVADFKDAVAINKPIYDKYKELLSYAEPIKVLLNSISVLKQVDDRYRDITPLNEDLEREIKNYVNYKLGLE